MDETAKPDTTALPLAERPDVHQQGAGRTAATSLEQDKDIREGRLPADRFDDERMKDLPAGGNHTPDDNHAEERERTELGNRGPSEVPGFGQGA
jgi:hypothetical protein